MFNVEGGGRQNLQGYISGITAHDRKPAHGLSPLGRLLGQV